MAHTRQFNDSIAQEFSFKPPIMAYIFDNISYKHLYKLYQCCKLFPNKFPLIIISQITDTSTHFYYNNQPIAPESISEIWLTNCLSLVKTQYPNLPEWISKIRICTIKMIDIRQDLSLKNFKILINGGNIESLTMGTVINENGISLPLEEIVAYVPLADTIRMTGVLIFLETFPKLTAMKRKRQISVFELGNVNVEINPDEFLRFIETHASKYFSYFFIFFNPLIAATQYVDDFRDYVNDKIPKLRRKT